MQNGSSSKAFTLIELLVVIAIIAILAAILFPVFAQAKLAAKKAVAISNVKQVSLAATIYATDSDDTLCQTSWESSLTTQAFNPGGKYQIGWTYLLQPYAKNWDFFVDPGDTTPTTPKYPCVNGNAEVGKLDASGMMTCDWIAQKYSFVPNYSLMAAHDWTSPSLTSLEEPANTIAMGLRRNKLPNGTVIGQHKGLSGFNPSQPCPGSVQVPPQTGLLTGTPLRFAFWTPETITPHLNDTKDKADLLRIDWERYSKQSVYGYADGHAKMMPLGKVLDPSAYQFGSHFYSTPASYNTDPCTNNN